MLAEVVEVVDAGVVDVVEGTMDVEGLGVCEAVAVDVVDPVPVPVVVLVPVDVGAAEIEIDAEMELDDDAEFTVALRAEYVGPADQDAGTKRDTKPTSLRQTLPIHESGVSLSRRLAYDSESNSGPECCAPGKNTWAAKMRKAFPATAAVPCIDCT